jgi:hypothetical protein
VSDLTEVEIFDCLFSNLRGAIDDTEQLSRLPLPGPTYARLRERLKLVEGAARQAAHWREDTRWLPLGIQMETCHQLASKWLREHYPPRIFLGLKAHLQVALQFSDRLKDDATGRIGTILPEQLPEPHRETRPVQVGDISAAGQGMKTAYKASIGRGPTD